MSDHIANTEPRLNSGKPEELFYSARQVSIGTAFGGPLTAAYLLAKNYSANGEGRLALIAMAAATLIGACLLVLFSLPPYLYRIPGGILILVFGALGYLTTRVLQGPMLDTHEKAGGRFYSYWRVLGIAAIAAAITLGAALAADLAMTPAEESHSYGKAGNVVYFEEGALTATESDKIADVLEEAGLFNDQKKMSVYVEKEGKTIKAYFNWDPAYVSYELLNDFKQLRGHLQERFPGRHVVVIVVDGSVENSLARFE